MILLVTYDLKGPAGSYQNLINVIKGERSWWHYMRSPWLVATSDTPQEFYEKLAPHLRAGDRLFVVQLQRPFQGYLPRKAWDWIHRFES